MAGAFRNIQVLLTANASSLKTQLAAAAREVDAFGRKVEGVGTTTAASSKALVAGVTAAGAAVGVALGYSLQAATQFETRMRNVNSISGLSEQALASLGGEVLDLSRNLPQSANVLAEGLYDIASSGFQGAEGLKVLEAAAKAASAGLSTTAVSGRAITAVLNAYGLDASKATDVSDTLFQTVNLGVVSFEELAGVIGDTLGTAAAAAVSIDQVGAALATMTLAGISGAEASTSLNRLLQELIKPGDALTLVLRQLGYESGTQALKAKGLHGVMEQLRVATGGNVEALLQLFPEIRAARGALALMAKDGENYTRVSNEITDAEKRRGATQRALNEQMKALSAQWTLFRNRAAAAAIELGTRLIPAVLDTLNAVQSLARSALPTLQHGLQALAPFFANLRQIGGDLVDIARSLIENLSPVGKVLAGIVAGAVITGLNSLAAAFSGITGFLAEHSELVTALAIAYGVKLAASLASAAVGLAALKLDRIGTMLGQAALAVDSAAGSFLTLGNAVKTIGFAAAIGGVTMLAQATSKAKQSARQLGDELTKDIDPTNIQTIEDAYRATSKELEKQTGILGEYGGVAGNIKYLAEGFLPLADNGVKASESVKDLRDRFNEMGGQLQNFERNAGTVAAMTGLTSVAVKTLAKRLEVDLTGGFEASTGEREKLITYVRDLAAQTGVSADEMADATEVDIAKMEELGKAIADVQTKVNDVFASSTDFIAAFKADAAESSTAAVESAKGDMEDAQGALAELQARSGEKTRQDVSDQQALRKARERVAEAGTKGADELADATQALSDLEERQAAGARTAAGDQRALQKARERVAEATDKVREAESKVTTQGGQIATFYEEQIARTSKFASDLTTVAAKGLDPEVIKRLLTAGPEQAAPILEALLGDHSGRLIGMVNESEDKLRAINVKVTEFARLTQRAVSAETDTMARDLGTAMDIAAANMEQGASATVASIAAAIGVPAEDVRRVAREYGITLADEVSTAFADNVKFDTANAIAKVPGLTASPSTPGVTPPTQQQIAAAGGGARGDVAMAGPIPYRRRFHGGGSVPGPNGSDVPAVLQTGEFVLRRSAAQAIGTETLHALNRYHQGGHVGRPMPSVAVPSQSTAIDYDRLAAAVARTGTGPVNAPMSVTIQGGGRPTRADLEYANRQHQWALAGAVTR